MSVLLSRKNYYVVLFIFAITLSFISCKEIVQGPDSAEAPLSTVWSLTPPPAVYPYNVSGLNITVNNNAVYGEIRYTTNGDDPISLGLVYSGSITITGPCTVKLVSITNGVPSEVYSAYYTFKLSPPVFNFPGGLYNETKNITLSSLPAGVTIRYTLDGSDPKTSGTAANYAAAIPISVNTTIRAYGYLAGYVDSDVATHNYVIMPGLFVKTTGNDTTGDGSPGNPYQTITKAISMDPPSKKIYVAAGTYNECIAITNHISVLGGYNNANWLDVNVQDRENPTYRTEIAGTAADQAVIINSCDNSMKLQGFTIRPGSLVANTYGIVVNGGNPKIQYNTIGGGNGSSVSTGITAIGSSSPHIQNNIINGGASSATSRGISVFSGSNPTIEKNIINGSTSSPGASCGIYASNAGTSMQIFNNLIFGGTGTTSYAIHIAIGGAKIYNNTISSGSKMGATTYGFYANPCSDTSLINNVFFTDSIGGSHHAVYINSGTLTATSHNTYSPDTPYSGTAPSGTDTPAPVVLDVAKRPTSASDVSIRSGGDDLSAFYSIDIQGNSRTVPWSRGCYEYD